MKLASDSWCFIANPKSDQLVYGCICGSPLRQVQLPAHLVQRRDALAAAAGDVQDGEVQRQAEEPVPDRLRHELVDGHAGLARSALEDRARRLGGRQPLRGGRSLVEFDAG